MPDAFIPQYLTDAIRQFRNLKALAEGAMAQIDRKALYTVLDEEANSIAVLLKHMAGSMRARWADFPAAAEDMGARNRDSEFMITEEASKEVLLERWEAGWQYLFDALERLTPEDMAKTVHIRGKPLSVIEAINRQLTHYAYHVGQIVFLAKHLRSGMWRSLSIPRRKSEEFSAPMRKKPEA
ncbi:MAG TPA: DUF1572 family protein [Candidatus Tectomicrobia bacterium]|nr:DUF1572 family protein [Candidatus Tectomicrobia bacterium]